MLRVAVAMRERNEARQGRYNKFVYKKKKIILTKFRNSLECAKKFRLRLEK